MLDLEGGSGCVLRLLFKCVCAVCGVYCTLVYFEGSVHPQGYNFMGEEESIMSDLTLEEVKTKTMELLETTDSSDVDYITQEMVESDLSLSENNSDEEPDDLKEAESTPIYGHNMRYSNRTIDGKIVQVYVYDRGPDQYNRSHGCRSDNTGRWLRQDRYDHWKDGDCSRRDARIKFKRR
jgi:hypothetical protein